MDLEIVQTANSIIENVKYWFWRNIASYSWLVTIGLWNFPQLLFLNFFLEYRYRSCTKWMLQFDDVIFRCSLSRLFSLQRLGIDYFGIWKRLKFGNRISLIWNCFSFPILSQNGCHSEFILMDSAAGQAVVGLHVFQISYFL